MGNVKKQKQINFNVQLNDEQKVAKSEILNHPMNFIEGMAGSGKTLLATQIGLDLLFRGDIDKIIITRPTVSTEDNGFLPGSFKEKMEPWMVPIWSNMRKVYNHQDKLMSLETDEIIQMISLTHFRGQTFDNAVCIIDEYQNLTKQQMVMALGRLGKSSKMIFCGDPYQIDLKIKNDSAVYVVDKIKESQYVYKVVLKENHRHPAVNEVLKLLFNM